jgi:Tfp pilus assembly protein PilN
LKTISLLPPELKKSRADQRKQSSLLLAVAAPAALALLVYSALFVTSFFLRADLQALRLEREAVEREAAALNEYAVLHQELLSAEGLLVAAMGTTPPWAGLIREIGLILPTGVWLSEVTANYLDTGGELTLRGWAYTHDEVAAMLEQIYTLDQLDDIRCQVSLETLHGGQPVVQFTVKALLKTGPAFITTAEGGS